MSSIIIRTRSINERAKLRHLTPIAQPTDEISYTPDYVILWRDRDPVVIMVKASSDRWTDADIMAMTDAIRFDHYGVHRRSFQTWHAWTAWIARRDAFAAEAAAQEVIA